MRFIYNFFFINYLYSLYFLKKDGDLEKICLEKIQKNEKKLGLFYNFLKKIYFRAGKIDLALEYQEKQLGHIKYSLVLAEEAVSLLTRCMFFKKEKKYSEIFEKYESLLIKQKWPNIEFLFGVYWIYHQQYEKGIEELEKIPSEKRIKRVNYYLDCAKKMLADEKI